ncbi:MAG: hypothetical protein JRI80_19005 [Deltaproteobacteria bacterium]|nr:hypothetical protein [Deltaproteobacteria bacterium]
MVKASSRHYSIHLGRLLERDHGHDPVLVLDHEKDHVPVHVLDIVLNPDLDQDQDLDFDLDLDNDLDLAWSKPALDIAAFI